MVLQTKIPGPRLLGIPARLCQLDLLIFILLLLIYQVLNLDALALRLLLLRQPQDRWNWNVVIGKLFIFGILGLVSLLPLGRIPFLGGSFTQKRGLDLARSFTRPNTLAIFRGFFGALLFDVVSAYQRLAIDGLGRFLRLELTLHILGLQLVLRVVYLIELLIFR